LLLAETVLVRSENSWLNWPLFIVNALLGLILVFTPVLKDKPFMQEALAKVPFTYEVSILNPLLFFMFY
jgi:intracellular septation protein A